MSSSNGLNLAIFHGLPAGGARRTAFEQAKRLSPRHTLTFYSLGGSDDDLLDIRQFAQQSTIVPFHTGRLFRSPLGRLNQAVRIVDLLRLRAASQALAAAINANHHDAILIHPCQYAHVPWLLQFLRVPALYYCQEQNRLVHSQHPPQRPYSYALQSRHPLDRVDPLRHAYCTLLAWIEKRGLNSADRVLANSAFTQQNIQRLYGLSTSVNYLGIDVESYPAQGLPRDAYVLSVGALSPLKGFDLIIEALGQLPASIRPRLILAGYSQFADERAYLEGLAAQHDVDLQILLRTSHDKLVELYNRALLTIYTPVEEPFGLVPLESMACGTPVVGVAEGGVKETIVDGVTGSLVPRNADALAQVIAGLLANPRRREEMGQNGRQHVQEKWNWSRSIDQLENHLMAVTTMQASYEDSRVRVAA
jgi:glycosyltransferase involved in cell wall biosynthesis